MGIERSWWFLAAVPCVWLASLCAQPNLNFANGCLAYVLMIVGVVLMRLFLPLGSAVLAGTVCGFYLSAIEKWIFMREAATPEWDDEVAPHEE
jgi:hypothetical protein